MRRCCRALTAPRPRIQPIGFGGNSHDSATRDQRNMDCLQMGPGAKVYFPVQVAAACCRWATRTTRRETVRPAPRPSSARPSRPFASIS